MANIGQDVQILGQTTFQRNYLWEVRLPTGIIDQASLADVERLVQSVQFGDYSIDSPTTMRIGAFQAFFASLLTVQKIQMSFLKTSPDIVSDFFAAWKDLIVDDHGLFQPKNSYQRDIYVTFLDADGSAFGRYKLIGCFPVTFPAYRELSYDNNTVTKLQIEFQCDKIEYETQ